MEEELPYPQTIVDSMLWIEVAGYYIDSMNGSVYKIKAPNGDYFYVMFHQMIAFGKNCWRIYYNKEIYW